MWPLGCPYRKALETWLNDHNVAYNITSIASYGTILGCVGSGSGVSLVPRGVFERFKTIGNISGYTFNQLTEIQNYFIWNKHIQRHHARESFLQLVRDGLGNLPL